MVNNNLNVGAHKGDLPSFKCGGLGIGRNMNDLVVGNYHEVEA